MRKKIMHITQSNGGVKKYLEMFFTYANTDEFEHILIYPKEYEKEKKDFENMNVPVELFDVQREIDIKKDFQSMLQIRKIIKNHNPDIIYLHSSKAGVIGRIANIGLKSKVIYNSHGWSFNMKTTKNKKNLFIFIEKTLSVLTDKIIAISSREEKSAIENRICKQEKIEVIKNGIDIEKYQKDYLKFNAIEFKKSLGIPMDNLVIGMVGRISEQKSPEIFVELAEKICKNNEKTTFIIVGDGELKEEIEKKIKEKGLQRNFIITGWVNETFNYIKCFDVAVLLSKWEGFGLVLAEYMLCEKIVVANNVDAIPEIVEHGETGFLVEIDDLESIVEIIEKQLNGTDINIIKKAVAKVKEEYDIKRVVKNHEHIFKEIVGM